MDAGVGKRQVAFEVCTERVVLGAGSVFLRFIGGDCHGTLYLAMTGKAELRPFVILSRKAHDLLVILQLQKQERS